MRRNIKAIILICMAISVSGLVGCNNANQSQNHSTRKSPAIEQREGGNVLDRYQPIPYVKLDHPEWSRNAVLYQINIRQYSREGTFAAVERDLPRLQALGVDILWLMPIHPIGEEKRKGSLGSYYAVKDYYGVNPEFGNLADLKSLVSAAHQRGMHVILDWVANHTAWDNSLVKEHPEWYVHDWKGDFRPTLWFDWSDIIDLDYTKPELREYMTGAMKYWVAEAGIDGFRCDVAGFVPLDFWENVRAELDAIKPVFMLAEYEGRDAHARAFDATYAWSFSNILRSVANGKADVGAFSGYYSENQGVWPNDAYRMTYTTNHDVNSWDGTDSELYGAAKDIASALTFISEGIPLIYNGQEAGLDKRLAFFEKDPIEWRKSPKAALYKKLIETKHNTKALWNGAAGARMIPVVNSAPKEVLSFVRFGSADGIFAIFNFSPKTTTISFSGILHHGEYHEIFTGEAISFRDDTALTLDPWAFKVYKK
ncbi:MAG: alpha-amylase family glycosyl hydrolase [Parvularculaceae bacterium]